MTMTPALPGSLKASMPKGKDTGQTCALCEQPLLSGQLVSGVFRSEAPPLTPEGTRPTDEGYLEGHYACVLEALGPEDTLKAVQQGRLPNVDPAALVEGCLPTHLGGL